MKRDTLIKIRNKKAQDEMVGFGLIIIVVAVILLAFVVSIINKSQQQDIENYEVNAFIQSTLQYTTACEINSKYINVKDLMFECANEVKCTNNLESCIVLENTLKEILRESWKVGGENVTKGYKLFIGASLNNGASLEEMIVINAGTETKNSRGNFQDFVEGVDKIEFQFDVYY